MGKKTKTPQTRGNNIDNENKNESQSPRKGNHQETHNKMLIFLKNNHGISLTICFVSIIVFYSYYSYLQELLLADKSMRLNTNVVLAIQAFIGVFISASSKSLVQAVVLKLNYHASLMECLHYKDFVVGFLCWGSMYTSNYALKFVDYPFVVLAKSAKIMPVILMGALRKVYTIHFSQYVLATFISLGLILFNYSSHEKMGDLKFDNVFGISLVVASLIFDGLTSSQTDKQHKESGRDYAYSIMFSNNFVALIMNVIFYIFNYMYNQDDTLKRIYDNPYLLHQAIYIGLSGAIGQIFIFFTISLFNCYVLTIITTTRKLFSVVISNYEFHHQFSVQQWIGAGLVMVCTFLELFLGKKPQKEQAKKQ